LANLANRINISSNEKDNDNISNYLPQLIWVLRDNSIDKIAKIPNDYLESCLTNIKDSSTDDINTQNNYKDIIRKSFKSRDCFMLISPTTEKDKNLEDESISSLRPEFIEQVNDLLAMIKSNIAEKKINNNSIDGEALFSLLQSNTKIKIRLY
jgi:hypothetical protein